MVNKLFTNTLYIIYKEQLFGCQVLIYAPQTDSVGRSIHCNNTTLEKYSLRVKAYIVYITSPKS